MHSLALRLPLASLGLLLVGLALAPAADETPWTDLTAVKEFGAWKGPTTGWTVASEVGLDDKNPKKLTIKEGTGLIVNGPTGNAPNLISKENYKDIEAHVEFLIPKGSNSGVKFQGQYEIQIVDSADRKELTGDSCGGIYPRREVKPNYHHIDKGFPPKVNAAKPAGEWQVLDVIFQSPRFDEAGKKTANAKFVKVVLNGKLIHENQEAPTATGHAWHDKELPEGPLLLQGDHGAVAFRNVRLRPYVGEKK